MPTYTNILAAVDVSSSAEKVLNTAANINPDAQLTLIHVIDYIPYMGFGEGALIAPTYTIPNDELVEIARKPLLELQAKLNLKDAKLVFEFGTAGTEIANYAEKNNIDLIVVGSHGRHGVKLLLGSTANSVLHHAHCDVLALRIKDE